MAVAAEDASRAASAAEMGKTDGESEDLGAAHRQGVAVDISYQWLLAMVPKILDGILMVYIYKSASARIYRYRL